MTDNPTREQIESFIESLAEGAVDPWEPTSWRDVDDPDDNSYRVVVTFQFDPAPHQHARFGPDKHTPPSPSVRKVVEALQDEGEYGAPVEAVADQLRERGVDTPYNEIGQYLQRGEIYEPREDYLRVV